MKPRPGHAPIGVIVANLGTPDAPTARAVRRYLREFLTDPKVVDLPRIPWRLLLEAVILPRRVRRVARAYESIWMPGGSPLLVHTRAVAEGLAERLGDDYRVVAAMRYGRPSLDSAVDDLAGRGCERVILLPLFPQWSDTTTGTLETAVAEALARRRDAPELTVVPAFPEDPGYVDAVARRYEEAIGDEPVDDVLFSFHGLPERYIARGDPYLEQCERTAAALARRLGLASGRGELVFQSRFGREPWLSPFLDETLERLGSAGGRVAVLLPGFAADCLETLEEVAVEGRRIFREAGGGELVVVPALNAEPPWISALEGLVREARGQDRRDR